MIKDKLENIERYSVNEYFEELKKVLKKSDGSPEELPAELKAIQLEYVTGDPDLTKFENHERNIDMHLILKGEERIGLNRKENLKAETKYDEEKDFQLFSGVQEEEILLREGEFALLFPGEIHVTSGKITVARDVKKMVFKIPY